MAIDYGTAPLVHARRIFAGCAYDALWALLAGEVVKSYDKLIVINFYQYYISYAKSDCHDFAFSRIHTSTYPIIITPVANYNW